MSATLAIRPIAGRAPNVKRFVVDCRHGRTTADLIPGSVPLTDAQIVGLLIARHEREEGCTCTRRLRRRYGGAA